MEIRVQASPEGVTEARKALGDYAQQAGCDREAVELAVAEAVANAVMHAYPDDAVGEVTIRAEPVQDSLVVDVWDDGSGMRPNPDSPGLGLGLPLIASVSDDFMITRASGGGALVSMRFKIVAPQAE